ncbi:hypothetical protein Trydic_g23297 [Trypoxylus dichotomus]
MCSSENKATQIIVLHQYHHFGAVISDKTKGLCTNKSGREMECRFLRPSIGYRVKNDPAAFDIDTFQLENLKREGKANLMSKIC